MIRHIDNVIIVLNANVVIKAEMIKSQYGISLSPVSVGCVFAVRFAKIIGWMILGFSFGLVAKLYGIGRAVMEAGQT